MEIGKLYKVIRNGHTYPQVGDVIMYVQGLYRGDMRSVYFTGLNLRTMKQHHYKYEDVEVLCE
ncbi:MAG: hypothetical protein GOVbin1807_17 [Prokaryotic dsDNA virus sp.]|nr:MAG: hypothetical protein GOVbin1807_17 [Prokaryotic dsDNA virus sp.]